MGAITKLIAGVILNRLDWWVTENDVISEYEAAFRKGYSTVDNILNLMSMINLRLSLKKRKDVLIFF